MEWVLSMCLQSQQPPPPSHHLSKPKGDATLKMRASVRVTRYLESWGAARPFAHLNHRESVSSSETPVPNGRRPKVGSPPTRTSLRRDREQKALPRPSPLAALWVVSAKPRFWNIWRMLQQGLECPRISWSFSSLRKESQAHGEWVSVCRGWPFSPSPPLQATSLRRHRALDR